MATVEIEDKELIAHNGKVITVPEALQKIGSKRPVPIATQSSG